MSYLFVDAAMVRSLLEISKTNSVRKCLTLQCLEH